MTKPTIAIIGGGLSGLSCALKLVQQGYSPHIFEAAPSLGGRTRSFFDAHTQSWVDNGPHLLSGAYTATKQLLQDMGASDHICWQPSLHLPLWDSQRGHFAIQPNTALPFSIAMAISVFQMPQHHFSSILAMLRLRQNKPSPHISVSQWLTHIHAPEALVRDMLEPLCLGSMNEAIDTANALSFYHVLSTVFSSHQHARLGWFKQPLQQAMIDPLQRYLEQSSTTIHCNTSIRKLARNASGQHQLIGKQAVIGSFEHVVLAIPSHAKNRLLGQSLPNETRSIANLHLWLENVPPFTPCFHQPFIGGIGTQGQWFFDVSSQMGEVSPRYRHICVVISAANSLPTSSELQAQLLHELASILGMDTSSLHLQHHRMIWEKQATTLVRASKASPLADGLYDASEEPSPGDLPATIETAIERGTQTAQEIHRAIR